MNAAAWRAEPSSDRLLTNPTTGIAGCCARVASGQATAAPPSSVMNSRRLMTDMDLAPPRAAGFSLSQARRDRPVLWAILNRSESRWAPSRHLSRDHGPWGLRLRFAVRHAFSALHAAVLAAANQQARRSDLSTRGDLSEERLRRLGLRRRH